MARIADIAPPRKLTAKVYLRDVPQSTLRKVVPTAGDESEEAREARSGAMQQFLIDNLLDEDGASFEDLNEVADLETQMGLGLLETVMDSVVALYTPKPRAS